MEKLAMSGVEFDGKVDGALHGLACLAGQADDQEGDGL